MKQYDIKGMSCAACASRIEKAISGLDGIEQCSVNLLTNSMAIEGNASDDEIIRAVEKAGYGASIKGERNKKNKIADDDTKAIRNRLIISLVLLAILMYISMGHMMLKLPLPAFIGDNLIALGILQMLLSIAVMVINQHFFTSGFKSLFNKAPNMDSLIALGSSAAFIYSTIALFLLSDAIVKGDSMKAMEYYHEFYFESAATILALITVGKMLESRSKGQTANALKSLMDLAPKTAIILKDGKEIEVKIEDVRINDIFVLYPGQAVPVDGVIIKGSSALDESSLTGESIPANKKEGDSVYSGTINTSSFLTCKANKIGEDTTLSTIIRMVEDASASKAPIAKIADKVSGIFVPLVITIAIITTIAHLMLGNGMGQALARGISVLVISCPCSLGLATPVAIMVATGVGAKNGILFKSAQAMEECGKAKTVVLDKTGTITKGEPTVTDVIAENNAENSLLTLAYSIEKGSEHPLAKAIVKKAKEDNISAYEAEDLLILPGNGLLCKIKDKEMLAGSLNFIKEKVEIDARTIAKAKELASEGKTPLFFAYDHKLLGIIAVADTIKEDSPKAIKELKDMGIKVVMLTGDNETTAKAIAKKAGVDEVIAGVLPSGKQDAIIKYQNDGKVIMVGDGINDAIALTRADIGVAIGAGADVAIEAADVVLMKSSLLDVPAAIRLSRNALRNIHQNLFWAFFYNIIGIPLAAGLFGLKLNPMFAALAMSLSSFFVVSNALRLNLMKIHDNQKKEEIKMKKTLIIEGMMCGHCEAHVKKALLGLDGVTDAEVSHQKGEAVITLNKDIPDALLKKAIEDEGYSLKDIR
ncbi:MAG: heavy metal translocating P-type ATPase [Erysipelotrichaceae bacterium]|nr:heavy metal translocating P-type ATPase [Erysipelotrichaceae bacterium]